MSHFIREATYTARDVVENCRFGSCIYCAKWIGPDEVCLRWLNCQLGEQSPSKCEARPLYNECLENFDEPAIGGPAGTRPRSYLRDCQRLKTVSQSSHMHGLIETSDLRRGKSEKYIAPGRLVGAGRFTCKWTTLGKPLTPHLRLRRLAE